MTAAVRCETLSLTLDERGRAVSLCHEPNGPELLAAQTHPVGLWQMGLIRPVSYRDPLPPVVVPDDPYDGHEWWANRDEYRADLELDSDDVAPPAIRDSDSGLILTWSIPVPGGIAEVQLDIAGGDRERLEFRVGVSLPDDWALKRVTFPRLRGLGDPRAPEGDALLYPETWGVLRRNPLEDMTSYSGQYPAHINWCQMAAWLHDDHGLYIGVLDPDSNHTGIDAQYVEGDRPAPLETDQRCLHTDTPSTPQPYRPLADRLADGVGPAMQFRCHHWPVMSSSWSCPYPVVLQGFSGTWYDAARIHRTWATQQRWCRRGPLAKRTDASPALAGVDLWFCKYGFHPGSMTPLPAWDFQNTMHALLDFFGVPFGVHWYHWHAFNWHRNFPSHSPVVEGFEEVLADLQKRGIVVMPYCQGRLLYRDRPTFEDERMHASVEASGQPYLEMYTSQDDWPLALCPSDAWSQGQWRTAARLLWERYGTDGVYFDQITAMPPSLCYHSEHGHPPGGGNSWWHGYDRALADMAPMIRENSRRFLSSELMADAYMDRIDLYLSIVPVLEDFVPLHSAIYGDYTTAMGRAAPGSVLEDLQRFAICQGEQLIFGGQLGWTSEEVLKHPEAATFLRQLVQLRSRIREFLHVGSLEPPLDLQQDARLQLVLPPELTGKPRPVAIDRPAIRHTIWLVPDGRRLVLLLNERRNPADCTVGNVPAWWQGTWDRWDWECDTPMAMDLKKGMTFSVPGLSVIAMVSRKL